jgi:hypothetical protein
VLVYLLAKPNDWQVKIEDLRLAGGIGRDKVYRILNELREAGYIERVVRRDPTTQQILYNDYLIYDDPIASQIPPGPIPECEAPLPENQEQAGPLPERPEVGESGPLPEEPLPAQPDTANQDGLINTQSNNIPPKSPQRAPAFDNLLSRWSKEGRPEKPGKAANTFYRLTPEEQRHALELAKTYQRLMVCQGVKPILSVYLRRKQFLDLVDAPEFDTDGHFKITPDRPEWERWKAHVAVEHGPAVLTSLEERGWLLAKSRWPKEDHKRAA